MRSWWIVGKVGFDCFKRRREICVLDFEVEGLREDELYHFEGSKGRVDGKVCKIRESIRHDTRQGVSMLWSSCLQDRSKLFVYDVNFQDSVPICQAWEAR